MVKKYLIFTFMLLLLTACGGGSNNSDSSSTSNDVSSEESVTFEVEGDKAVMRGVIDNTLQEKLVKLLDENPAVKTIEMIDVPGSADDDANLQASRIVRNRGINTHVPANGEIASGGVDFFVAGAVRTIEDGAKLGVHSWADDENNAGSSFPQDDEVHSSYLDYYTEMGITTDFYWFTLQAAPPEGIHNMTMDEMIRYGIVTN